MTERIDFIINERKHMEKVLKNIEGKEKILDDIFNKRDREALYIRYSLIGHDEEHNGRTYHCIDKYRIHDLNTEEDFWCSDSRISPYISSNFLSPCHDFYTDRDDTRIKELGITYTINRQ